MAKIGIDGDSIVRTDTWQPRDDLCICVACRKRLDDPQYMVKGFAGIMRHECPPRHEAARLAAATRAERGYGEGGWGDVVMGRTVGS